MSDLDRGNPVSWIEAERALNVSEAARYCGVSVSYLNKLRVSGGGPIFEKAGRVVRYDRATLDEWRRSRRFGSTSGYAVSAFSNGGRQ